MQSVNPVVQNALERAKARSQEYQINDRGKICPFQSTADKQVPCSSLCQLFKPKAKKYECPLQELSSINFALSGKPRND